MNDERQSGSGADERTLEEIFRHAAPRPKPRRQAAEQAFERLYAEWRDVVGRRRRQRLAVVGLAAMLVVAAVTGSLSLLREEPSPEPLRVAVLRASGAELRLNEQLRDPGELAAREAELRAGDRLATGRDTRIALAWGSGSLRLDRATRVRFLEGGAVRLLTGSLYFDSTPFGADAVTPARLEVVTPLGRIRHDGTQFLARVADERLTVSVREGRVHVVGDSIDVAVDEGEAIEAGGDARFERRRVPAHDETWQWTAEIAPEVDLKGRTIGEMLAWIARETGRRVRYESAEARRLAESEARGIASLAPLPALRTIPVMTSLECDVEGGYILVDVTGSGSEP